MFVLKTLEDKIRLDPKDLGRPTEEAVLSEIERRYLDKVILNVGLAITIYDLMELEQGHVHHSDGGAHHRVVFRLVVFAPFVDEVLKVRVLSQDPEVGIRASVGFFHDLVIPPYAIPEPHMWVENERTWCWELEGQPLYIETGGQLRVKVSGVRYSAQLVGDALEEAADGEHHVMEVTGKVDGQGLGMVHWYEALAEE